MRAAQEVTTEVGGRAGSLRKVLLHDSSGGALVWSGGVGVFGTNDAEVGESAYRFPAADYKKIDNAAEGWSLASGDGKNIPTESGDTSTLEICGQAKGSSGRVGAPTAYFWRLCKIYRL